MDVYSLNGLGHVFREKREELGHKIEELSEEGLSIATISNFETGKKKVSKDKIIRLFDKIDITMDQIPQLLSETKKQRDHIMKRLELQLIAVENEIDFVDATQALKKIKNLRNTIQEKKCLPHLATLEYLAGNAYYKKENWTKSQDYYHRAIRICHDHPEIEHSNIKAGSFYGLARISFRNSDISNALKFVSDGLTSFQDNGDRKYLHQQLMLSKAIYSEMLERNEDAFDTLSEMWQCLNEIDTEIILNMYQLQSSLYIKRNKYDIAISYAVKGIDIARRNKNFDRSFELWITLGSAYIHLGNLDQAKICFETASQFESKIRRKILSVHNLIQLGLLYMKEGDAKYAQALLENAAGKAKKENDALLLFKSLEALGDCLLQQLKHDEALGQFECAYEIAQKHSFLLQEHNLSLKLAEFYEKVDLTKHTKYSTRFYRISVQLRHNGGEEPVKSNEQIQYLMNERQSVADPPDN
ncbi:tetratricopeptide (TPR) repeat protein [Croceifilum oryzae]|uniref:Tetratricopeptide (TPR) repeat protein n=1 Tax=Croceifilum oryzae TaxID=1553429 RepID=A0AAJ1WRH7_9BACL|nr:helix-turn-helix domain-containing protein [Croceifilum oryzae]MDQ0416590.1 tetratricopeptide (TPR) repeat protein [Croceifilum oryzae]